MKALAFILMLAIVSCGGNKHGAAPINVCNGAGGVTTLIISLDPNSDTGTIDNDLITNDTTPDFIIEGATGSILANDIIRACVGGVSNATHTITAGEVTAGSFSLGMSALANGTYNVTMTLTRGANMSVASNTVTITITASPP